MQRNGSQDLKNSQNKLWGQNPIILLKVFLKQSNQIISFTVSYGLNVLFLIAYSLDMSYHFGCWRYYAPGNLESDQVQLDEKVISEMLELMGFNSVEEFNKTLATEQRNNLPTDLQNKIKNIFEPPDEPIDLWLPETISAETDQASIKFKNPIKALKNPEPLEINIYGMNIETNPSCNDYTINLRAGISSNKLFEPLTKDHEPFVRLATEKTEFENINIEERQEIIKFLQFNKCNDSLANDNDLLYELGIQIKFLAESIGISTLSFVDADGGEGEFWIDGDEEIGFN